jgi:hypothetical protein
MEGLYIFCAAAAGGQAAARQNIDASAGAVAEIERIVALIRGGGPTPGICLRADSGFAREELMAWREENRVDSCSGSPATIGWWPRSGAS